MFIKHLSKCLCGKHCTGWTVFLISVIVLSVFPMGTVQAGPSPGAEDRLSLPESAQLPKKPDIFTAPESMNLPPESEKGPVNLFNSSDPPALTTFVESSGVYPQYGVLTPFKPEKINMSSGEWRQSAPFEDRSSEVPYVGFWLNLGKDDWIWGNAIPDSTVNILINDIAITTASSDSFGDWGIENPVEINPGDEITITAGEELEPVVVMIPDPLIVQADSGSDVVWGQVSGLSEDSLQIDGYWEYGSQPTTTDIDGFFSVDYGFLGFDIPGGGEGNIYYSYEQDSTWVDMNVYFRTPDLMMTIHSDYDWIEGPYEPEHTITLTVYDGMMAEKANITVPTGSIEEWGGASGYVTWHEDLLWSPEPPDIQPGDWVHGEVDDGSEYWANVQIGSTTGNVDIASDNVSGTVYADWLIPFSPITVECYIWDVGDGPEKKVDAITPDGLDQYNCSWSGEWDIVPGQHVQVAYHDINGHFIMREFHEPAAYLRIEKGFIGDGSPGVGGNVAFWVQYQNQGDLAAENVTITDVLDGLTYIGDTSGFSTYVVPGNQEVSWDLGTVEPGDWVGFVLFTEVTVSEGNPISNTMTITTTSHDFGAIEEKTSTWEGTVAGNDTHLSVGKDTWTWNPAPGENYVYQINVCNNGSTSSSKITLTEVYPGATILENWWGSDPGWQEIVHDDHTLELEHICISPNTCSQVYLLMRVKEQAQPGEELINHVEIAADNDMETEDNYAELQHNIGEPFVDIAVDLAWHSGKMVPGGEYHYGIHVINEGNVAISGPISVTAQVPDGTSFVGWDSWDWIEVSAPIQVGNEVTWQVNDMAPGYRGVIEMWLDIDPGTAVGEILTNIVDVAVQPGEDNIDNNHDELVEFVRDHGPNLRVTKWAGWEGPEEGQNAWWQIQLENMGDEIVYDVNLTDYYPEEMALNGEVTTSYSEYYDWEDNNPEDNAFTMYFDRIEPGWNFEIYYNTFVREEVTLTPAMPFSNAVIVSLLDDIEPENNFYEYILVYIGPRPHLQIEKHFIGNGSPGEGGNAAFWVQYQNQGGLAAENVEITDVLEGMDYISDTSGLPISIDGNQVTWDVGTVEPGDWIGFLVFAEVTAPLDELIRNTVRISTTTPYDEGDESEKMSTWEDLVSESDIDLNVGKGTWTQNPAPGEDFVYQINICNNGSTSSSVVTLIDTLPNAVAFGNWWSDEPGWNEVSQIGQTLELSRPCLSSWSCSTVYVRVTVDPLALPGDALINQVTVNTANDINLSDNTTEIYHEVGEPYEDLVIWLNWHWGSLVPGGHYRLGMTFSNQGNTYLNGPIEVTATLPDGVSFVGWDNWDWISVEEPVIAGNQVIWEVIDLPAGYWGTIELWLDIESTIDPGTVLGHLAEIEIQPGEENTGNNASTLEEVVQAHGPNLRVRKWGEWRGEESDYFVWYELRVENIGDEPIENVVVTDTFPVGMTLRDGPHVDFWEEWDCDVYIDEFSCVLSRMEPGWNVGVYFELTPDLLEPGYVYTNTAEVSPFEGDVNSEDNLSVSVLFSGPDMKIEKKLVEGDFLPGSEVTYILRFGNAYTDGPWWGTPWWWGMQGNAIIIDTLPDGMSYVSAYHHWCDEEGWWEYEPAIVGQDLIWAHDPLGYYNCFEILLTAAIDEEIFETNPLINQVVIESNLSSVDIDPFPENNTSEFVPELIFDAPVITSVENATFTVGSAGSFTITSTGFPNPEITYTGTLPGGVALVDEGDGTATLSGTPVDGTGGVYELEITAANGVLPNDVQTFFLTINESPTITSANAVTFEVGSFHSFSITTTGYPLPDISYTGLLPEGVTFTDNGDGTATIEGTPVSGAGGLYELTITASNITLIDDEQSFTLTVEEAPRITSSVSATFKEGIEGVFTITTTGFPDPDITYSGLLPDGVTFIDNADGTATLSGTPIEGSEGDYVLSITANNGILPNDIQTFTLTIEKGTLYIFLPLILR